MADKLELRIGQNCVMEDENMNLKLANGQEVALKINFKLLLGLKERDQEAFEKGNRVIMEGTKDTGDIIDGIYAAYVCANEEHMSYEEFAENIPFNVREVSGVFNTLYMQDAKK